MIGDHIELKAEYLNLANQVLAKISDNIGAKPFAISISGESGSGKSTLAVALAELLDRANQPNIILHMDDYFKLPPLSNHKNREKNLGNVGQHEVFLDLLDNHIEYIKFNKYNQLIKPLSDYASDEIREEVVKINQNSVIIVEGTYTTLLQNIDIKIFIDRDYKSTLENRKKRARDPITPFVEKVLAIEHEIISGHKALSDIIIDQNYQIINN